MKNIRRLLGLLVLLCLLLAAVSALAADAGCRKLEFVSESPIAGLLGAGDGAAARGSAEKAGTDIFPARGANVDLWVWAKYDTKYYDMTDGKQVNDVRYTVLGTTFKAEVVQGYPWLKVSNRTGFGWFKWSVEDNKNTSAERIGIIKLTDSRGVICTITFHQTGSPEMVRAKADKKNNVKLTFRKAQGTSGTAIYGGKKKLNKNYTIGVPKLKKLALTTKKSYVHKKQKAGFEYWYLLRPYVVLGSKKLIGPEIAIETDYAYIDWRINQPFFDYEIVDINPPGFDSSWDW